MLAAGSRSVKHVNVGTQWKFSKVHNIVKQRSLGSGVLIGTGCVTLKMFKSNQNQLHRYMH